AEGLSVEGALGRARAFGPGLAVLQAAVPSLAADAAFAEALRGAVPGVSVAAWGADFARDPGASLEALPAFDAVIFGRPEPALAAFGATGSWESVPGAAWRRDRAAAVNPAQADDGAPFSELRPARHLLSQGLYVRPDTGAPQAVVVTGQGCPFQCSFCLVPCQRGGKVWLRDPASVVAELEECVRSHGIRDFLLHADTFTLDRSWVLALCAAISGSRLGVRWVCNSRADTLDEGLVAAMAGAGCWGVSLGLESGLDATLERLRKGHTVRQEAEAVGLLRAAGILSFGYFMMGFPWEDAASIEASFEGLLRADPDLLEITFPMPFAGTVLASEVARAGMSVDPERLVDAYSRPVIAGGPVPPSELERLRSKFLRRFYFRPRSLRRTLGHLFRSCGPAGLPAAAWRAGRKWAALP
ncbi:MAG: radical SAM protein, partial [Elusimicrobiota bacterium]